jgi:hypothetical protein
MPFHHITAGARRDTEILGADLLTVLVDRKVPRLHPERSEHEHK